MTPELESALDELARLRSKNTELAIRLDALRTENNKFSQTRSELEGLVRHCWVFRGHLNCGRPEMTERQKAYFEAILND